MKITVKFKAADLKKIKEQIDDLKGSIDKLTATRAGFVAVAEMKDMISKGISPIKDAGRFPAYKNPKKYPANKKGKRPVNLKLTGDFLRALEYKAKTSGKGYSTEVGFWNEDESIKEKGHREGANTQPKRPIIPEGNEELALRVKREIVKVYRARLNKLLNRK